MKKLFLVFSAFALVFSSCSTTGDPDPVPPVTPPSSVLLTKLIDTHNGVSVTNNITYIGNKVVSNIRNNGTSEIFTYTGDLITKIEDFTGSTLNSRETFTYNTDGKVATYINIKFNAPLLGNYGKRYVYVYNTDGTISITKYTGNEISQTVLYNTGKAFFTSGQITKVEENVPAIIGSNPAYIRTSNYVYDTKSNAANNVTGFSKLILQGYSAGLGGNIHNLLSVTDSNGTSTTSTDVSTFTYNASNYPVTETNTSTYNNATGGPTVSTSNAQYFY